MLILLQKLKALKVALKDWSKAKYSNMTAQVAGTKQELTWVQEAIKINPLDDSLLLKEKELLGKYNDLLRMEEDFAKEQSRAIWLKEGDKNLPYYHQLIKSNRARNSISKI